MPPPSAGGSKTALQQPNSALVVRRKVRARANRLQLEDRDLRERNAWRTEQDAHYRTQMTTNKSGAQWPHTCYEKEFD
jgi:hypothetical protein